MSGNFQNSESLKKSIESPARDIKLDSDYHIEREIRISRDDLTINGNGHTLDAQNRSQIFNITGNNITLKNITFKNAFAKNSGGAILNFKGSLKIINCKFIDSATPNGDGGAVCNWRGTVEIEGCEFESNASKKNGGAIFNGNEMTISDCKFHNNSSRRGLSIFNTENSNLTLKKSSFHRDDSNLEDVLTNNEIFNRGILNIDPDEKDCKNLVKYGFIHEISPDFKQFRQLDNLIRTTKEITLDSDIELSDKIVNKYGITLDVDGLVIDGNGHSIDALGKSRIFTVTSKNVTLKNINFRNGASDAGGAINNKGSVTLICCSFENNISDDGGAIYNAGSMDLDGCNFESNISENDYGGAIQNDCEMTLTNCSFKNNISRKNAGAISNSQTLTMKNCRLTTNISRTGGAITNIKKGIANILKCDFKNNYSYFQANSIFNDAYLNINKCNFENVGHDTYQTIIYHNGTEDSEITIENSKFTQDNLNNNIIFIQNGFCSINYSKFDIKNINNHIIFNENAVLTVKKVNFNENVDALCNNNILKIRREEVIEGQITGRKANNITYLGETLPENWKGFRFLDNLIHSGENIVNLECDITIHESEHDFYESGIEIEMDNITINGNYHTIDTHMLSRIFIISGKNVTLKNIRFRNAKYYKSKFDGHENGGGAIYAMPKSSIEIDSCIFSANSSRQSGGAICNKSMSLTIRNCIFESNHSQDKAGAIFNQSSKLSLEKCYFITNDSNGAGAIYNVNTPINMKRVMFKNNAPGIIINHDSKINFSNCKIKNNASNNSLGIILNKNGEMNLENCEIIGNDAGIFNDNAHMEASNCKFIKNSSSNNGTCLHNQNSNIKLIQCEFKGNSSQADGGAIYNRIRSELYIESCRFSDNTSSNGAAIANMKKCEITLRDCDFENNESKNNGAGIYNWYGFVNVFNSRFLRNECESLGGAIDNYLGLLTLEGCRFSENKVKRNGGAIMNGGSLELAKDCIFESNAALFKGGAIYTTKSSIGEIESCKFYNNNAYGNEGLGGAIYTSSINNGSEKESLSIFNCDFYNNFSTKGATAIFNNGYSLLKSCNFSSDETAYIEKTIINKGKDAQLAIKNLKLQQLQMIINNAALTILNKDKSIYENIIENKN